MIYQAFDILMEQADEALLRAALNHVQEILTDEQRFYILHCLKAGKNVDSVSTPALLQYLEEFIQRSRAGYFYREFDLNSSNYTWIPPHTEAWCYELGLWLDKGCTLAQAGEKKIGLIILEACQTLLDDMMAFVFADELGDWMIHTEHDYQRVYASLKGKK